MTRRRRVGLFGLAAALVVVATGFALAWHPTMRAIAPPARTAFAPAVIARGADLASLGYCASCHTRAGGASYAGGLPIATPFGTLYSTNITPDVDTGIGTWSEKAFRRAMRAGIDRTGGHLYPAFPYTHFAKLTDADVAALYAYVMTRAPVREIAPRNRLAFPFNWRVLMAGWNLLYLDNAAYRPDPAHDAAWNHGAYLVQGLSHCGACHSPRNALGAEVAPALGGGMVDNWDAPALNAGSPAPEAWTQARLVAYLRHGLDDRHGGAAGPMGTVVDALSQVPQPDIDAIGSYIASLARPGAKPAGSAPAAPAGEAAIIFAGACAGCHGSNAPATLAGRPSLALSTTLAAADPRDAIHVVLGGIQPQPGKAGLWMPPFDAVLSDAQLASLLAWLRAEYGHAPPWPDLERSIFTIRSGRADAGSAHS